jgi:pimeloyl-ACP methyl ester carboxylesterase
MARSRFLRWSLDIVIIYTILLGVSTAFRLRSHPAAPDHGMFRVEVPAVANDVIRDGKVSIAYQDFPAREPNALPPVLFLHGSPGHGGDFDRVVPLLGGARRVISPDLPGFGRSNHGIPDYSIRSHAIYVVELLDALKIDRVHVVAFSLGGGVGLNLFDVAPQRVASITMLSGLGVQEMELLGDYHLNHLIHGVQLLGLYWLRDLTPHFGYLDDVMLSVEYGRNFYDTDQRPLREMLKRYDGPMLIIHGKRDGLVPVEAALEHRRLVPQSELVLTEEDHFMVFLQPQVVAPPLIDFLDRADAGKTQTRSTADSQRIVEALRPMRPGSTPKAAGVTALVILLLLAVATLVSEDLACISGGLMVAQGRAGFLLVTIACLLGIFVGDMMLFVAGRFLEEPRCDAPR